MAWFKLFLKERWIALAVSTAGLSVAFMVMTASKAFEALKGDIIFWSGAGLFLLMIISFSISAMLLISRNWREPTKGRREPSARNPNGQFAKEDQGKLQALPPADQTPPLDPTPKSQPEAAPVITPTPEGKTR